MKKYLQSLTRCMVGQDLSYFTWSIWWCDESTSQDRATNSWNIRAKTYGWSIEITSWCTIRNRRFWLKNNFCILYFSHAIISYHSLRILLAMSCRSSRSLSPTQRNDTKESSWRIWRMYKLWDARICRPAFALSFMISLWSQTPFTVYGSCISKKLH